VPVSVTYTVVNSNPSAFSALPNNAQYTSNLYGYAVNSAGKTTAGQILRPNGSYGAMTDIVSNINSKYNALVFQVQHRLSHNIQFQSSYTWSHVLDFNENNTTFSNSSSILDPRNFHLEYGNGNQNIPNRVIATAIINSPRKAHGWKSYLVNGYELAPSFSAQNGAPYSAVITGNPSALVTSGFSTGYVTGVSSGYTGTGGSTRIPGLQRNTFAQPRTILLDLRGSKRFTVHEGYTL
jgi:hypothetical protein